jgi:hypothetical protein
MKPDQLITSQGTVTARYNNKKEPTPQVTALPGISTYWPLPCVSCRAIKPGAIPTASAVKNNQSRKVIVFPLFLMHFIENSQDYVSEFKFVHKIFRDRQIAKLAGLVKRGRGG